MPYYNKKIEKKREKSLQESVLSPYYFELTTLNPHYFELLWTLVVSGGTSNTEDTEN